MRTIQAGCFNRGCTLRDAKFFWCSCNEQDSQYRRNQATLNIQVAKRFLTEKGVPRRLVTVGQLSPLPKSLYAVLGRG